jgi:UDP-GlcNAc:undecaprenyl-phosphate/decaprenyl-phosphate GlcNAc-1-phosphate transferase
MPPLAVSFAAGVVLGGLLTRLVRDVAMQAGIVDLPDGRRRVHTRPTPRLGGVALFLTFLTVWLVGTSTGGVDLLARMSPTAVVMLGGAAIFLLGLVDDLRGLRPLDKLIVQVLVASAMFYAGVRFAGLNIGAGEYYALPLWISYAITVVWIVGITNAFNLIDGSDGVAGGAALFAALTLSIVFLLEGEVLGAATALTLAGAILGFLFFNFPPATIFLGDSGSLFIGFMLATMGLVTAQKAGTMLSVAIPVVSLGLPILDTGLAMFRRFVRRQPVFGADRGHIHHRLRDLGHSPRSVALALYAVCGCFAMASLLLLHPSASVANTVLLCSGAVVLIVVQRLHIPELIEVRRIISRTWYQRTVVANNVRIREAVDMLEAAADGAAVDDSLRHALEQGEFQRAELRLDTLHGRALAISGLGYRAEEGWQWSWGAGELPDGAWEIRVPLRALDGSEAGYMALWCPGRSQHLLTDMGLLVVDLSKALIRALDRLGRTAAEPARMSRDLQPEPARIRPVLRIAE